MIKTDFGEVYNEDFFKSDIDKKFDLILLDPPWGETVLELDKKFNYDKLEELFDIIYELLNDNGWCFLFAPLKYLKYVYKHFRIQFEYVWVKQNATPRFTDAVHPRRQHELIFALVKKDQKPSKLFFDPNAIKTTGDTYKKRVMKNLKTSYKTETRRHSDKISVSECKDGLRDGTSILYYPNKTCMKRSEITDHPTQKPVELIKLLIKGYCNGLVLDPFAGSGATAIACESCGVNYVTYEIEKKWYDLIKNRLYNFNSISECCDEQKRLF